jgi:S-adenosylmethionine hydrolase
MERGRKGRTHRIVTLLTDFGDYYPGVMKGVMLKRMPDLRIVDITHSVEPQNVLQGAFLLYNSYRFFPPSIHIAVVDPGVGGKRDAILIESKNHVFVGPDNGILHSSAAEDGIEAIWKIKEEKIDMEISSTFHGRDVFAPAVCHYLNGEIEEIAEKKKDMVEMDIFECEIKGDRIRCRVIFTDRFGNAVTNLRKEIISKLNPKAFYVSGQKFPLVKSYSDVDRGEPLSIIGSFNSLELSIREGNASEEFNLKNGLIELEFE